MLLPSAEDRGIVVFRLWPSLPYNTRLTVGFLAIASGLFVQGATGSLWVGLALMLIANSLLIVSGYDNRVDFGRFDPSARWERVEESKLETLRELDRRIRKWDLSSLDVTNLLGTIVFLAVVVLLALGIFLSRGLIRILFIDAAAILLPHWLTGVRRILTKPKLNIKVEMVQELLKGVRERLGNHRVSILMLLRGGETQIPEDVKFKIDIEGRDPDFLGLYGHVVLNDVQGTSYPYFYVVLVARRSFGLSQISYSAPQGLIIEVKNQDEVEVFVIRQRTTKTSGYHTKGPVATRILNQGILLAEQIARGQGQSSNAEAHSDTANSD